MAALKRALVRMEHWLEHNRHHCDEYEKLAQELETAGKVESAAELRVMIADSEKGNESLQRAIAAMGRSDED